MKQPSAFPINWSPPEKSNTTGHPDLILMMLGNVDELNRSAIDIRNVVWTFCDAYNLLDTDRALIMEPYINGFWKVSDGLSVPHWLDGLIEWRGKAQHHGLSGHPAGVRHDYDWRVGNPFRRSNKRFADLAAKTGFSATQSRAMYNAVTWAGWPRYVAHRIRGLLEPSYRRPPWK